MIDGFESDQEVISFQMKDFIFSFGMRAAIETAFFDTDSYTTHNINGNGCHHKPKWCHKVGPSGKFVAPGWSNLI